MGAAPGVDGNLAQTFRTLFSGGIGGRGSPAGARNERIDGSDHKKVNRGRNQQEADHCGKEIANREDRTSNGERDSGEVGLADQESDERVDKILDQSGHDCAEGGADDDTNRQINDVAA